MWSRELVELLLTKYREHENLYNVSHPKYADRVKRSISMFAICKDLREFDKSLSLNEQLIKKKIHTLRSQYIKELRDIANQTVGTDEYYEPKLWCFSQMDFLKPYCSTRKVFTTIAASSDDSNKSLPPKRKKVVEEKQKKKKIPEDVFDAFEESGNDLSVLAQGWSSQYAELSKQQKVYARKIISDVLFHGCLDNLRESTVREIHNVFEDVGEKPDDPLHSDE